MSLSIPGYIEPLGYWPETKSSTFHAALVACFSEARRRVLAARDRRAQPYVSRLQRAAADMFREELRLLESRLPELERFYPVFEAQRETAVPIESILEEIDRLIIPPWIEASTLIITDALADSAKQIFRDFRIKLTFDRENTRALSFLKERAAELVKVPTETRRRLNRVILDGVTGNKSWQAVVRDIRLVLQTYAGGNVRLGVQARSRMIARTEINHAFSEGTVQAARQMQTAGLEMEKAWITAPANEQDPCTENEAAGWIGLDEIFPSGHDRPPEHPNCLCVLKTRRTGAGQ